MLEPTPSQTIGPFFGYALPFAHGGDIAAPGDPASIVIRGHVYDGADQPVPDALIETWQADPAGSLGGRPGSMRSDPTSGAIIGRHGLDFTGFARVATDADGHWSIRTTRPGGPAPYLSVCVFARGLLHHLYTRIYLPEHASVVDSDPALSALPVDRRATLVAVADGASMLRFDIRLQGTADRPETVFFQV